MGGSKRYTVAQGDSIESIAHEAGHLWKTVWEHADNKPLRELRKNAHVLLPGDVVVIPDVKVKTVSRATGGKHEFKRKGIPSKLRVRFLHDGEPRANAEYVFTVDGKKSKKGKTDGDGWLDEPVSPLASSVEVRFPVAAAEDPDYDPAPAEGGDEPVEEAPAGEPAHVYHFDLRHLDPSSELSGALARLHNLGYSVGEPADELTPRAHEALCAFQHDQGIEVTGELDDATQAKLAEFGEG